LIIGILAKTARCRLMKYYSYISLARDERKSSNNPVSVIPVKTGIQAWIPDSLAASGMTKKIYEK